MKTPALVLKTICCTLLMLPIVASCSKDDEERNNPEIPSSSSDTYVLDLEDISGGTFNGSMYLPTAGASYYSDGTWGNNPHASDAVVIGMIGNMNDATKTGIVVSLNDITPGTHYVWSQASGLAASYTTAGTAAGNWFVGTDNDWVSIINALYSSTYSTTKEVWQGGGKLYATINKRLADVGATRLNGGYWTSSATNGLIIFNARDGFYIDDDVNQYLESVRPFMNVTLAY